MARLISTYQIWIVFAGMCVGVAIIITALTAYDRMHAKKDERRLRGFEVTGKTNGAAARPPCAEANGKDGPNA